jgi:DNA-binding response OmpR family regulator
VDDDEQIVESLLEALQGEGLEFDTAYTGRTAVDKISTGKFDLVLLDFVLPEMNGIEILKTVKPLGLATDFIMITGFGKNRDGDRGDETGRMRLFYQNRSTSKNCA